MGLLRGPRSHEPVALPARALLGRSAGCALRASSEATSQEHAAVWWEGGSWWIRDLASRNGTRVDGVALRAGEPHRLAVGNVIEAGDSGERWTLVGDAPPEARAVPRDGAAPREARDGLLALPDESTPLLVIHRRWDGRWLADDEAGSRRVSDLEDVVVSGRTWRLHLPELVQPTLSQVALRLPDVALTFHVSASEEDVEMTIANPHGEIRLPSRTHAYVLLLLARARIDDAALSEPERGWVDRERLCAMLAIDRLALNLQLHRARRQLAEAGVDNVGALIERRAGASALRLGVARLRVADAGRAGDGARR